VLFEGATFAAFTGQPLADYFPAPELLQEVPVRHDSV